MAQQDALDDADPATAATGSIRVDGADAQAASPLFALPREIRDLIFEFALSAAEDPAADAAYAANTCYRRPGYAAPRRVLAAALLQTCRRAYSEAWWRPWAQSLITVYLTGGDRRPERTTSVEELAGRLARIAALHSSSGGLEAAPEVAHVRVFAQLYLLESGHVLQGVLGLAGLRPRRVTLTLRHTDWWFWERDEPLHFKSARFVNTCRFPASVRELRLELESLERKRTQVDYVAAEAQARWCFTRADGVRLVAAAPDRRMETMRWSGSSTWNGERWIRDEVRPGELDYYVKTVVFRPETTISESSTDGGQRKPRFPDDYQSPTIAVHATERIGLGTVNRLSVHAMETAGVPPAATADEALALVAEHRRRQMNANWQRLREAEDRLYVTARGQTVSRAHAANAVGEALEDSGVTLGLSRRLGQLAIFGGGRPIRQPAPSLADATSAASAARRGAGDGDGRDENGGQADDNDDDDDDDDNDSEDNDDDVGSDEDDEVENENGDSDGSDEDI